MSSDLSMTAGVRRFVEYARTQGYEPQFIAITPDNGRTGATTLVYATTNRTYFLVFQRRGNQKIPRKTIKKLIVFKSKDLLTLYNQGALNVHAEMKPGYMTPFVSESFKDFSVHLDRESFENGDAVFPAGAGGNGFVLPSYAIKELLIGLYGEDRVHIDDFFDK